MDAAASQTGADRRLTPRHDVTFHLVCSDGRAFHSAVVLDLSLGGVRVRSPVAFELGAEMQLIPVGDAGEILFDVEARVARVTRIAGTPDGPTPEDRFDVGLQFVDVDEHTQLALAKLLREMPNTDDDAVRHGTLAPAESSSWLRSKPWVRMRVRRAAQVEYI
jgi:hypothetical protein